MAQCNEATKLTVDCRKWFTILGAASVARGYSGYLDSLIDYKMQEAFRRAMPINAKGISAYPDFFAFGITFVLASEFNHTDNSLRKCLIKS